MSPCVTAYVHEYSVLVYHLANENYLVRFVTKSALQIEIRVRLDGLP